ncbi:MAG: WhiB family transcriptional regulator [Actinobacteria bacterium]|nr:WhiB family transcriptional regulator [Actinomycetota bacterium]
MGPLRPPWHARVNCRGASTTLSLPAAARVWTQARRVCGGCQVRRQSLEYAWSTTSPMACGAGHRGGAPPDPTGAEGAGRDRAGGEALGPARRRSV